MTLKTETLEKQAAAIAEVLASHKVFGVVSEDASEEEKKSLEVWVEHEKTHFVGMVLRHALDPLAMSSLVLNYKDTGAMVELDVRKMFNTASFMFIKVVPVLSPNPTLEINPHIDYEALKEEIQAIRDQPVI